MSEEAKLSYIEFAVIAVVLGLVSITVVPKIGEARTETKISSLIDGLEMMRAQLDLYRVRHQGLLPPTDLLEKFGAAITTKTACYEPYIKKIPVNPFNDDATVRFDGMAAGLGTAGWRFDTKTGAFQADDCPDHAAL